MPSASLFLLRLGLVLDDLCLVLDDLCLVLDDLCFVLDDLCLADFSVGLGVPSVVARRSGAAILHQRANPNSAD